MEAKFVLITNH